VLAEYFETGLVSRMPTWVLSTALMMISFMLFTAGVILDSVARARAEQLRIHYMGLERLSALKAPLSDAGPVSRARPGKADAA